MSQAKSVDPNNRSKPRVVLLATDRSQSIIGEIVDGQTKTIAYSAYGEQSAQQKVETRLGFNGQLREADIGWYLLGNGYRAYNPRLMRFHSPDSWSPFGGGGLNAYMYCVGDPVNRGDPTGHSWLLALALAASDFKASFKFRLPNYRGGGALPKIDTTIAANAARALQHIPIQKTKDLDGFFSAAEYITGPKSPTRWTNDAAELHSGVQATPYPQQPSGFLGSSFFSSPQGSSGGRVPRATNSSAPRQAGISTGGRPTNSGGLPTYNQAMSGSMLSNKDTLAAGLNSQEYKVYHMEQRPPQYENLNIAAPRPAPVVQQVPVPQLPAAVINVRNAPVRGRQPLRRTNDVSRRP
jgi:RHS repeat-associated protein